MAVISKIRQNVGLLVFVIAIAILCFLLMDVFSGPGAQGPQAINAGTVNGQELNYQTYQDRVTQAINNETRANPNMTEQRRLQVSEQTWNNYVKEILAKQEYDKLGINVQTDEVMGLLTGDNPHPEIKNTPTFQDPETKQFDPERVRQYVRSLDSDEPQAQSQRRQWNLFVDYLKKDQARKKYNSLIKKAVYVPTWYAEQSNVNTGKKVDIDYVMVPYSNVEDSEVSFSDTDLRAHLTSHAGEFKQEAASDIEYVAFPVEASETDRQNVEMEINSRLDEFRTTKDDSVFVKLYSDGAFNNGYLKKAQLPTERKDEVMSAAVGQVQGPFLEGSSYKAYKVLGRTTVPDSVKCSHILRRVAPGTDDTAVKKTIDSLYNAIVAGGDFEELAVNFSEDKSNAENGGDLGWTKPGRMVKPFNDAIFYQAKPGEVTKVKTQFGWHIVKVYENGGNSPAVKVAFLQKDILPSTETNRNIYGQANEFAGRNNSLDAFRSAAEQQGLSLQAAPNLNQSTLNIPGIGANNDIASWAFSKNVGAVSNVFVMDDKCVVAVVTKKRQAGTPTLDDVRTRLESAVIKEKKAEKLKGQISGNDLNAIASSFGQEVQSASGISFDGGSSLGREPQVQAVAVNMGADQVSGPIAGEKGVYVIRTTSVTDAPATSDYTTVKNRVANTMRSRVDFGAMEAIRKASDVQDERYKLKSF